MFAERRDAMDMTGEIFAFYENAGPDERRKPTAVLRYIARNHKGFFALSVFIHLMKHLGALLLPVFVANIINIVTDTGAFFIWPVAANILASLLALTFTNDLFTAYVFVEINTLTSVALVMLRYRSGMALSAAIRPKMTISATALPPRRLPPWTPPQTSPAANSPGMAAPSVLMTSAAVLIFTPPMVWWIPGAILMA